MTHNLDSVKTTWFCNIKLEHELVTIIASIVFPWYFLIQIVKKLVFSMHLKL